MPSYVKLVYFVFNACIFLTINREQPINMQKTRISHNLLDTIFKRRFKLTSRRNFLTQAFLCLTSNLLSIDRTCVHFNQIQLIGQNTNCENTEKNTTDKCKCE